MSWNHIVHHNVNYQGMSATAAYTKLEDELTMFRKALAVYH